MCVRSWRLCIICMFQSIAVYFMQATASAKEQLLQRGSSVIDQTFYTFWINQVAVANEQTL